MFENKTNSSQSCKTSDPKMLIQYTDSCPTSEHIEKLQTHANTRQSSWPGHEQTFKRCNQATSIHMLLKHSAPLALLWLSYTVQARSNSIVVLLWDHLFSVCITLLFDLRLLRSTGSRSLLLLDTTDNVVNP